MATERDAHQAALKAQAELRQSESSGVSECDALYEHLAVVQRQRSALDADASTLRQRLSASELLVEALSEEPDDTFKIECDQLREWLASERLRGDEAQVESSNLSRQLRLQEFQSEQAQALTAKMAEKLHTTELHVEEVIQKTMETYSTELEALQQQSFSEGHHHAQMERSAASTVEALQKQVEQAVAAASDAHLKLESTVASNGASGVSPLQRFTSPDIHAVERRAALDIELQKQVILGALQKRGCPSR